MDVKSERGVTILSVNLLMKRKIVVIITRAEIGGAQNYVYTMIESLKDKFDFIVYSGSEGFLTKKLSSINIKTKIIPSLDSSNILLAVYRIRRELGKDQPRIINTHSSFASFYGRIASIGMNLKTIYSVHGWIFSNTGSIGRKYIGGILERFCTRFTTHWVTETYFDRDVGLSRKIIPNLNKVSVVYNGVQGVKSVNDCRQHNVNDDYQIVFVGRVSIQKNPIMAVKVMTFLPERYYLTIYCDKSNDKKLNEAITSLRLGNRVKLISNVLNTSELMYKYDALLVTSQYEGMPLCMLEAMSASLPIVASDTCGLKELVVDGENGFLVKDFNCAKSYAEKILQVFKTEEKRRGYGIASRERYFKHHTLNGMTNKLASVFNFYIL